MFEYPLQAAAPNSDRSCPSARPGAAALTANGGGAGGAALQSKLGGTGGLRRGWRLWRLLCKYLQKRWLKADSDAPSSQPLTGVVGM